VIKTDRGAFSRAHTYTKGLNENPVGIEEGGGHEDEPFRVVVVLYH
jgi:hypothetical protein